MRALTCSNGCKHFTTLGTEIPCRECLVKPAIRNEAGAIVKFIHYEPEEQSEQISATKFSFKKGISNKIKEGN